MATVDSAASESSPSSPGVSPGTTATPSDGGGWLRSGQAGELGT